jgi:peptidoglycan/xylan/chitin deacetylase (PgdA/CDA1 family)
MNLAKDIMFKILGNNNSLNRCASILMYHSVGKNEAFFTVTPEEFEWQVEYVVKKGFKTLKISDLVEILIEGGDISNCVVFTFDDGYKDNYEHAFKNLKKYNVPATIFLITGEIGTKDVMHAGSKWDMLSEADISEMHDSGLIEFMPHTVSHSKLSEVSIDEAEKEIRDSRNVIEGILGYKADIFAYPYGNFNDVHTKILKDLSWSGAVTVKEGLVTLDSDIYLLPRNSIDKTTSRIQFNGKISRSIERYQILKDLFRV